MAQTKQSLTYIVRTVFDARPFAPILLVTISGGRGRTMWIMGAWGRCWRVR